MSCEAVAKVPLLDDNTGLSWRARHGAIGSEEPIGKTSMRVPTLLPALDPAGGEAGGVRRIAPGDPRHVQGLPERLGGMTRASRSIG